MANYFKSVEKTTNRIWQSGPVSVETIVTTGTKNSEEKRLDAIYMNEYDSQKYSNMSKLTQVSNNPTFWLSISYKGHDESNNFISEDIWCSYRQVEILQDFLSEILETIQNDIDKIYIKNKVSKNYEDTIWQSEPLTGGKTLAIYPTMVDYEGNTANGVGLLIVDSDNESIGTEVSLSHFITLVNIINRYDLYMAGHAVWIESLLIQLLSGESGMSGRSAGGKIGGRTIGTKANGKNKFSRNSFNKPSNDEDDEEEEEIEENIEVDDEEEEPPKTVKKASKSKAKGKSKGGRPKEMSLDDMIASADNVDIDLGDPDDDDELF